MSISCGIGEATNSFPYQTQDDSTIRALKHGLDYLLTKRVETVNDITDDLDMVEEVLEIVENGD